MCVYVYVSHLLRTPCLASCALQFNAITHVFYGCCQRGKLAEAMDVLAMMEGVEYQQAKFSRPRFRSYKPVICELLRRGDTGGVMKLWKHMQWHNILPKVMCEFLIFYCCFVICCFWLWTHAICNQ